MALEGIRKRIAEQKEVEPLAENMEAEIERYFELRRKFNSNVTFIHQNMNSEILSLIDRRLMQTLNRAQLANREVKGFKLGAFGAGHLHVDCYIHACQTDTENIRLRDGVKSTERSRECEGDIVFKFTVDQIKVIDKITYHEHLVEVIKHPSKELNFGEAYKYIGQDPDEDPECGEESSTAMRELMLIGRNYLWHASTIVPKELMGYIKMFEEGVAKTTEIIKTLESSAITFVDNTVSLDYKYKDSIYTDIESLLEAVFPE